MSLLVGTSGGSYFGADRAHNRVGCRMNRRRSLLEYRVLLILEGVARCIGLYCFRGNQTSLIPGFNIRSWREGGIASRGSVDKTAFEIVLLPDEDYQLWRC